MALRLNVISIIFYFLIFLSFIQYLTYLVILKKSYTAFPLNLENISASHQIKNSSSITNINDNYHSFPRIPSNENKVAIIIPYLTDSLPVWFDIFALTAESTSDLFDWLIIVDRTVSPMRKLPSNVKLINLDLIEIYKRFAKLDKKYVEEYSNDPLRKPGDKLHLLIKRIIETYPYILVEFKPCLGYIFYDYIKDYSHWAYADLDQLIGRISNQISVEHLRKFDVITFSFGDNNRLYMRGQLTINRVNNYMLNLWRKCEYLSNIGYRIKSFYNNETGMKWNFQSAEGCYSRVIMNSNNINILIKSTQLTDAFRAPLEDKESFLVGNTLLRCYENPIDFSIIDYHYRDRKSYLRPLKDKKYPELQILKDHYDIVEVKEVKEVKKRCSYWIRPNYDVCVNFIPANATVIKENDKLYYFSDRSNMVGDSCREASISHFQGWKNNYYQYMTRIPSDNTHFLLISEVGFIPLLLNNHNLPTFGKSFSSLSVTKFNNINNIRDYSQYSTKYCVKFSKDLKKCLCPLLSNEINVIVNNIRNININNDITLITVAWVSDYRSGALDNIFQKWIGPKIIILGKLDTDTTLLFNNKKQLLTNSIIIEVFLGRCFHSENISILPDNVFYNIALDFTESHLVFILPPNININIINITKANLYDFLMSNIQNFHSSSLIATVIPIFIENKNYNKNNTNIWSPYPSEDSEFGRNQSSHLKIQFDAISIEDFLPIKFSAWEYSQSKTIQLPFIYNVTANLYGNDFIRFPEELSGHGCFGTTIFRILMGSGYKLYWLPSVFGVTSEKYSSLYGICINDDIFSLWDMINVLNRAIELRNTGVSDIYSREKYGFSIERPI